MWFITYAYNAVYLFHLVFSLSPNITSHQNWKFLNDDVCGISLADRIIGGRTAGRGQFPWLAQIGYGSTKALARNHNRFRCGAALINKYYVLTAAHCVANMPKFDYVDVIRLGEYDTETTEDCENGVCAEPVQDIKPMQIIIHNDYNKPPFKHDIALIRLENAAQYNGWVGPICMPRGLQSELSKNYIGETAEVAGWGIYDMAVSKPSKQLLFAKLEVQAIDICTAAYKKYTEIGQGQLCVGGTVDLDSCGGDSGGSLTKIDTVTGLPRHYAIGIVSFGPKHCGGSVPAVYTNVAHYMTWILNNIEQ